MGNYLVILIFLGTQLLSLGLSLGLILGSLQLCACLPGFLPALTWPTRLRLKHCLFESSATIRLSRSTFFALTIFRPIISTPLRSSLTMRFFITATWNFFSLLPYELHRWLRLCASSRRKAKGLISYFSQVCIWFPGRLLARRSQKPSLRPRQAKVWSVVRSLNGTPSATLQMKHSSTIRKP